MNGIIEKLAEIHPWLDDIFVAILLTTFVVLLWFALAFPANVLYHALRNPIAQFCRYLGWIREKTLAGIELLKKAAIKYRDEAVDILQLQFVFDQNEKLLKRKIRQSAKLSASLAKKANLLVGGIMRNTKKLETAIDKFTSNTIGEVQIEVPNVDEQIKLTKKRRIGIFLVVLGVLIMIALVGVNTLMLREYFAGFIDEFISFGMGIKLSDVLALLFTLLEISLGVHLYKTQKDADATNNIRTTIMEIVDISCIVVLAFIEGVLYLFLSAGFRGIDPADIMDLNGFEFITGTWLALFGPVVVVTLAATGHMLVNGLDMIVEAGHDKDYEKKTNKIGNKVRRITKTIGFIESKHGQLRSSLDEYISQFSKITNSKQLSANERLLAEVEDFVKALADKSSSQNVIYQVANKSETLRHFYKYSFFAIGGCIVMHVFVALQMHYLYNHTNFMNLPSLVNIVIAAVSTISVPLAAYMVTAPMRTGAGDEKVETIRSPRDIINVVTGSAIILAVIYFLWKLTQGIGMDAVNIGFLALIACVGVLILFGRALTTLIAVAWSDLKIATVLVSILPVVMVWIIALLIDWTAGIINWLIYIVAYPSMWMRGKRSYSQSDVPIAEAE